MGPTHQNPLYNIFILKVHVAIPLFHQSKHCTVSVIASSAELVSNMFRLLQGTVKLLINDIYCSTAICSTQ